MKDGVKYILFDMDGTLLPMVQEDFAKAYMTELAKHLAPRGYDPQQLVTALWSAMDAMVANDGSSTNEEVFWRFFKEQFGERVTLDKDYFELYYMNGFQNVRKVLGFAPEAGRLIADLKAAGYILILASNPIFPLVAQKERMRWAGVNADDFSYITSFENSHYCKPNPLYFSEIMQNCHIRPEQCMMIGNDAHEDLAATYVGLDLFLLTDCLINRKAIDISPIPHGGYADLRAYLSLPA